MKQQSFASLSYAAKKRKTQLPQSALPWFGKKQGASYEPDGDGQFILAA